MLPCLQAHTLETSYYKHATPQEMDVSAFSNEDPFVIQVVPVHLFGTVCIIKMSESSEEYKDVTSKVFKQQTEGLEFKGKKVKQLGEQGPTMVWKLTTKIEPADLVERLRAHSSLGDWDIKLAASQPLSFIATMPNVVNLARQLRSMGREFPDHLFCQPPMTLSQLEAEYDLAAPEEL